MGSFALHLGLIYKLRMKNLFRVLLIVSLTAGTSWGQKVIIPELPDVLKEKLIPSVGLLQTRPRAAAIEYSMSSPYRLETTFPNKVEGRMLSEERFLFKYKIPVLLKDNVKILLGHNFERTTFTLEQKFIEDSALVGQISNLHLKGNRFTIYGSYDLTETSSLNGALSISFNGNYGQFVNFDEKYRIFRTIAMYRKSPNANNDWGVGLYYKKGFRSTTFLPFGLWNKTFSKKWGFEAVLVTQFYMRYNLNTENIFLFGYQYLSEDYSVDVNLESYETAYEFKWPKINFTGRWQHRFLPFLWTEIEGGFQYNWRPGMQLEVGEIPENGIDIKSHSLMFNVVLFIAPPDKWLGNG